MLSTKYSQSILLKQRSEVLSPITGKNVLTSLSHHLHRNTRNKLLVSESIDRTTSKNSKKKKMAKHPPSRIANMKRALSLNTVKTSSSSSNNNNGGGALNDSKTQGGPVVSGGGRERRGAGRGRGFGMIKRLSTTTRNGLTRIRTTINSNAGGDDPAKRKLLRKQSKRDLSLQHKFHTAGGVYMDLIPSSSNQSQPEIIDEESSWTQDHDDDQDDNDGHAGSMEQSIIDIQPVLDADRGMERKDQGVESDDEEDFESDNDIQLIQRAAALCSGAIPRTTDNSLHSSDHDDTVIKESLSIEKASASTKTESTCATTVCDIDSPTQQTTVTTQSQKESNDAGVVEEEELVFDQKAVSRDEDEDDDDDREETDSFSTSFIPSRSSSFSSLFSSYTTKSQRNLFSMDVAGANTKSIDGDSPSPTRDRRTQWVSSGGIDHHSGSPVVAPRSLKRQELIDPKRPELVLGENEVLSKIMARSRRLPKYPGNYASLHVLINSERVKRQVAPLYRMAELDTMAREHAQMMAEDPDHQEEQHPSQRFLERVVLKTLQEDHGYPVHRIASNAFTCGVSELKTVHQELMEHSKSDRNNILDRRYTRMGVGTYESPTNGKLYVCQLFID